MATIDTPTIAQLLREFAGRASLRGGNGAKAYARAADRLAALVVPLGQVIAAGQLTESRASAKRLPTSSPKCTARARIPALKPYERKSLPVSLKC
jgi:hypothetical protein